MTVRPYGGDNAWGKPPVEHLRSGWLAAGLRFLAMARWDEEWRESVGRERHSPPVPVRVAHEAALFGSVAAAWDTWVVATDAAGRGATRDRKEAQVASEPRLSGEGSAASGAQLSSRPWPCPQGSGPGRQ
jgi:hypothetical protein